mmetsp:Transcript_27791/g.64367  ORF Transcript_27791/g.64367 Transcript_27791/m.64367 type:complete len:115 (-) Transcript_27791:366-710(-)
MGVNFATSKSCTNTSQTYVPRKKQQQQQRVLYSKREYEDKHKTSEKVVHTLPMLQVTSPHAGSFVCEGMSKTPSPNHMLTLSCSRSESASHKPNNSATSSRLASSFVWSDWAIS